MTATLHVLGVGRNAGLYYTNDPNREARSRGRDEYYTRDGGGVWHSSGQTVVAHGIAVEAETFRDLCAGIDPGTGKALVRGAGESHKAGIDVTFTPGKSVSILWMSGTNEQRNLIEAGHRAAVDRALQFAFDEKLVLVRHGAGGIHREQPRDLMVARFDHFTTRSGDPNVHSHCVVMNVAGSPVVSKRYTSKHLTIETDALFKWQMTLGSAYRAALAEQLQKAGFQFRAAGQGQWEIAGIPQALIEVFSKRSHAIEDLVGRDATAAQKEIAALSTRASKDTVLTGDALEAQWKAELEQTGLDPWALALAPDRGQEQRPEQMVEHDLFRELPAIAGPTPVAVAASKIFLTENVLNRQRLLEIALVEASLEGLGPDAVYAELTQLEHAGILLRLDDAHWTTPTIATLEASMIRAATRPAEREWITVDALTASLNSASHLTVEQSLAVQSAARSDGVSLIEAGAGTGKTTLAKAIVEAAKLSGLNVVGLAPSWVAAEELGASTGVPAQAIARWRYDLDQGLGEPMTASTLVLLDEAGMAGTTDMAAVLIAAQEAGAKVVLLGDRRQLQSVSGASALAAIADVVERGTVLDNVRRQKVEWQRAASVLMARGDAETGLRAYARNDRIELVTGEMATRVKVIEQWSAARQIHGDDVLIVTRRNIDAVALNLEARLALQETGRLAIQEVILPAIGRDQKRRDLAISVGEKLRFGETLTALGIRNGSRAVVEAIAAEHEDATLALRMESGEQLVVKWSVLSRPGPGDKTPVPRISHGYAGTAHSAQGRTAAATVLHIGRKTDAREIYVALTRHQQDAYIVVEADRLDATCRQRQEDPRVQPTSTALLERLFAEAAQYREKPNVINYVADRQVFISSGLVELAPQGEPWNILKSARAQQRLQALGKLIKQIFMAIGGLNRTRLAPAVKLPAYFEALRNSEWIRERQIPRSNGPTIDS